MAYYSIFPELDTTIYSHPDRLHLNTGHDEILEVVKEKGTTDQKHYPSRVLIRFSNNDLTKAIDEIGSENFNSKATCSIQLTSTEPINLTSTQNVEMKIVSASNGNVSGWSEGTGRYSNLPTGSNGVSWVYQNNTTEKQPWRTGSFGAFSTGSVISSSLITQGGGAWYHSSSTAAANNLA